jgi:hypothetical protein
MKRIIASFLFSTILFGNICFANDSKIPQTVLSSFKTKFQDAQSISWSDTKEFYKVGFSLNGQAYYAFYSHEGSFVALSRQVDVTQMPLLLQQNLQKKYGKFTVHSIVQMEQDDAFAYYADLQGEKINLIVKSGSGGEWTEFMRTKKK